MRCKEEIPLISLIFSLFYHHVECCCRDQRVVFFSSSPHLFFLSFLLPFSLRSHGLFCSTLSFICIVPFSSFLQRSFCSDYGGYVGRMTTAGSLRDSILRDNRSIDQSFDQSSELDTTVSIPLYLRSRSQKKKAGQAPMKIMNFSFITALGLISPMFPLYVLA